MAGVGEGRPVCENFFSGLLAVHEFFFLNFPLREFFFGYSPHNFSNGPSLTTLNCNALCQVMHTFPQGESHAGSPGLLAFHKAKSRSDFLSP